MNMNIGDAPLQRFSRLAVRRGISLGVLYSTHRDDFKMLLAAAAAAFRPGRSYSEREVNDVLRGWLATTGTMLHVDHVELRRWLVDNRLLDRDGFGRAYTPGSPAPELALLVAELSGHDLAAVAESARMQDTTAREERKRKWLKDGRDAATPAQ
jgi:hypothetical protein